MYWIRCTLICTRFYNLFNMKYGPDWIFILTNYIIQICTRFYDILDMKYGPDWMFILLWNSEIVKS